MNKGKIHPNDVFDKTEIFNRECDRLLDELTLLCSIHRIPFFWTAAVKNDENGTEYIRNAAAPASRNINLVDDQISKHLGVCAGFELSQENKDIDFGIEADEEF
jgi:hypothetical protein